MPFLFHEVSTYVIQYVTWENAAKFLLWNELGISISILLPSYSSSHSIEFPSYRMLHSTDGICVYIRLFHSMVKFTETLLSNGKNMEYWYQYFSQSMGYFFSVELQSEVLLKRDTPYPHVLQNVSLSTYNGPESTLYKEHLAFNETRKIFENFLNISFSFKVLNVK